MDVEEYFKNLSKLDNDNIHPEFHTFTTVWVRSRMPEIYADLASRYQNIEGQIMAQHTINDHDTNKQIQLSFDDIDF